MHIRMKGIQPALKKVIKPLINFLGALSEEKTTEAKSSGINLISLIEYALKNRIITIISRRSLHIQKTYFNMENLEG